MTTKLLDQVMNTITRHGLIRAGERVLVAVSGGSDSVCLLDILAQLQERLSISLCVGHVNHRLRKEAGADARYVENLARKLDLEVEIAQVDVKRIAKERKLSIEDAGRQARYEALEAMALRLGAACIATGHTADDQVETILLNFLRGGGPEGLAGMPMSRPLGEHGLRLIRPIIELTKAETESYCATRGLETRLDATNLQPIARRNRLRHEILPLLKKEQPALAQVLLRQAEIFRAEDAFLRNLAEKAYAETTASVAGVNSCPTGKVILLPTEKLNALPIVLARRVVREALRSLRTGRQPLGLEQVERVLALARENATGKRLDLGEGLTAEMEYGVLRLCNSDIVQRSALRLRSGQAFSVQRENQKQQIAAIDLPIRGKVEVNGLLIEADLVSLAQIVNLHADEAGKVAYVDAKKLAGGALVVRGVRPGDRFRPLGSTGSMKLSDFFINVKATRTQRAQALLVCHRKESACDTGGEECIVWVVGWRLDDRYKVTDKSKKIVRLRINSK
jgi:tRNA(Ile)-lysidine synthase